jgi:lipopolysaccharide/colanic/teichoic acid biosynthesis glycosyltransferase
MHMSARAEPHKLYLKALIKNPTAMKKLDKYDSRIIPYAKILRATGLDELPQLINVIKGDMSLVGPRPCLAYEAEEYSIWQYERFDTKPGLTGLWQVSGKNRTSFLEMMRFDARYAKKRSLLKDIFIIIMTIPALFKQVLDELLKKDKSNER